MELLPLIVLLSSALVVFRRPGFLFGSVFCAYQFEGLYDIPLLGSAAMVLALGLVLVLAVPEFLPGAAVVATLPCWLCCCTGILPQR